MNQLRQEVVRAGWRMAHRSPIIWRGIIDHKAGTAITPGHLSKPKPHQWLSTTDEGFAFECEQATRLADSSFAPIESPSKSQSLRS